MLVASLKTILLSQGPFNYLVLLMNNILLQIWLTFECDRWFGDKIRINEETPRLGPSFLVHSDRGSSGRGAAVFNRVRHHLTQTKPAASHQMLSRPGPFLQEQSSSLWASGLLYTPTAARKQAAVMKQKDVKNRVSRKTVWGPSPGIFFKMHEDWRICVCVCVYVCVRVRACSEVGGHLALVSWLLLFVRGHNLTRSPV